MKQLTITKNDGFGWTVWFVYEDEEMSHFEFDTDIDALAKFKELASML